MSPPGAKTTGGDETPWSFAPALASIGVTQGHFALHQGEPPVAFDARHLGSTLS